MSDSIENATPPIPASDVEMQAVAVPGDAVQRLTFVRSESTVGALSLGLAQYLSRLQIEWNGRLIRFQKVYKSWAEPESGAAFPAATIVMPVPGEYDSSVLTPATIRVQDGTNRYLRMTAELQLMCAVVVWTTDLDERAALTSLLEDALDPREGTTGLRLELPFYFGAHATYEKISVLYEDDPGTSQTRRRRTVFVLKALIPQFVPVGQIVNLNPRACIIVDGEGADE